MNNPTAWNVPGVILGSGNKRLMFGALTVPLAGQDEVVYGVFVIEADDDGKFVSPPHLLAQFADAEAYDITYNILQEIHGEISDAKNDGSVQGNG